MLPNSQSPWTGGKFVREDDGKLSQVAVLSQLQPQGEVMTAIGSHCLYARSRQPQADEAGDEKSATVRPGFFD